MAKTPTLKQYLVITDENQKALLAKADKILAAVDKGGVTPGPVNPGPVTPDPVTPPASGLQYYRPDTTLTAYLKANPKSPYYNDFKIVDERPVFTWFNGGESSANQNAAVVERVTDYLTKAKGKVFGLKLYAIPGRDGNTDTSYSKGGVKDMPTYKAYVGAIAYAITKFGNPYVDVVVETDALGLDIPNVYEALNAAVDILRVNSNTRIFLTASEWIQAKEMAGRLVGAGVKRAHGIAGNVSGRDVFPYIEKYMNDILDIIGDSKLQYLIDTSRNGAEVDDNGGDKWANTPGTKLGVAPQIFNQGRKYAYAWVKPPYETDKPIPGGPDIGQFWEAGLASMIQK